MNYGPNDNEISELYQGSIEPDLVRFDQGEIEQVLYHSISELQMLMDSEEGNFSYWFRQIIHWYLGNPSAMEIIKKY